jgi:hypothetical protein
MKKSFDTMKMVREARDELGAIRRKDLKEYFRQIEESGKRLLARRDKLGKNTASPMKIGKIGEGVS